MLPVGPSYKLTTISLLLAVIRQVQELAASFDRPSTAILSAVS